MGWTSARDTAQQLREMLYFNSKEEAVAFATKEGFNYTVYPYHGKQIKPKAFADNFKWKGPPKNEQK
jgi:NADH dehydrogenase (ubiquinone) Fe-S protein 4